MRELALLGRSDVPLTAYDTARLFLFALDRAISRLPWGSLARLSLDILTLASSDLELGQKPEFHGFLFKNVVSPFRTTTIDFLSQRVVGSHAYRELSLELKNRSQSSFAQSCAALVAPKDGS